MKIIITENQFNLLLEVSNPCPNGVEIDPLVTIDELKSGKKTIKKGYCNYSENSRIVGIQKMLKNKNLLDVNSPEGYYGDKTQVAVQKLFQPENVEGTQIGSKTLSKLEGEKKSEVKTKKPVDLFNKLTKDEKIIVCTLLGEAGGESNPKKGMMAVANVLQNRAENDHFNYGSTPAKQALAKYQFSMWNDYNNGSEVLSDVYNKYKNHSQMETAIQIAKSIESLSDITGGAKFYYATYVSPDWSKETDTTKWVKTTQIGQHVFGNVVKKKTKK